MNVVDKITINRNIPESKPIEKKKSHSDIIDILSKKVVNQKDITDTVTMPRTIFKGYLCFTAGTMSNAIGAIIKNEKIKKPFNIIGYILSIYGTYNFVKPYLIKNEKLTKEEK